MVFVLGEELLHVYLFVCPAKRNSKLIHEFVLRSILKERTENVVGIRFSAAKVEMGFSILTLFVDLVLDESNERNYAGTRANHYGRNFVIAGSSEHWVLNKNITLGQVFGLECVIKVLATEALPLIVLGKRDSYSYLFWPHLAGACDGIVAGHYPLTCLEQDLERRLAGGKLHGDQVQKTKILQGIGFGLG